MEITSVLKTVAPWIATALGGPLGGLAVGWAAEALGASDKTVEGLKTALAGATPEQLLALKTADQAFAVKMQELGFANVESLEAIAADDRKDARSLQASTPSPVPAILSVLVTIGYFGVLVGMMSGALKVADSQALLIMLGSLGTAWAGVLAFWFGTTRESSRKTELIAQSSPVNGSKGV